VIISSPDNPKKGDSEKRNMTEKKKKNVNEKQCWYWFEF
jgi:hypothetical protein